MSFVFFFVLFFKFFFYLFFFCFLFFCFLLNLPFPSPPSPPSSLLLLPPFSPFPPSPSSPPPFRFNPNIKHLKLRRDHVAKAELISLLPPPSSDPSLISFPLPSLLSPLLSPSPRFLLAAAAALDPKNQSRVVTVHSRGLHKQCRARTKHTTGFCGLNFDPSGRRGKGGKGGVGGFEKQN